MFSLFAHVTDKMDPSKFRTIGAVVTAFKLLLLAVDTLNGVVINVGILDGKVKINDTFEPNEDLALGGYIAPAILYLVGGIVATILYTCATTCYNSQDDSKVYNCVLDIALCTLLIIGGLCYYCGDNLPTLATGLDLNMNNLEIVTQILLFTALLFYRFIPLLLTKAKLVHRGFDDQEYFSQVALDSVALTVDTDAVFSIIIKAQRSCTMESNATGSSSLEIVCPEGHIYRLLWAVYAILIVSYISFIFLSLSFKYYQSKHSVKTRDLIGAILFYVLAFLILPLYLAADNQLPLSCEHTDDPKTAVIIRVVLTIASLLFYSIAFLYQIVLYILYIRYE